MLALAGTFAGSPVEQALFERLDKWSQGSSRYNEAKEGGRAYLERRWQEIKERQACKIGKASIATVITFARAQDPAYDQKLKNRLTNHTVDPLKEAIEKVENASELTKMLPDLVELALGLPAVQLTRIRILLEEKNVKAKAIDRFESDIKATERERGQKKAHNPKIDPNQFDKETKALVFCNADDAGHAEGFLILHPNEFVTVDEWGLLAWDGKKWEKEGAKKKLFSAIRKHLGERAKAATQALKQGIIDEKEYKNLIMGSRKTTARINAVMTQVMMDFELHKSTEMFDVCVDIPALPLL